MKQKTCKHCELKFEPTNALIPFCSPLCHRSYEKSKKVAKIAKLKENKEKVKAKKKVSVSFLSKKLDLVFSHYIRRRDAKLYGRCSTCGAEHTYETLQCGHFITRASRATRWHELNSTGQDSYCNVIMHGRQYEHGLELDRRHGEGTAQRMLELSKTIFKVTPEWLQERIEYFTSKLAELENT